MRTKLNTEESGQALVELSLGLVLLCVFVFGIIDFGRAIYDVEVMKNLVGEGSSMASRTTTLPMTATIIANDAGADINISTLGCVIVTSVANNPSGPGQVVTGQASTGGICASHPSKVGCLKGQGSCGSSTATLPPAAVAALAGEPAGSYIAVTEIYYTFNAITPLPGLLGSTVLPSNLYSIAYY
jgi:Flp pilus assembly protein TadG